MKTFRVLVEGKGLGIAAAAVGLGTPDKRVAGFFTTRLRRARSGSHASEQVLAEIRRDWKEGKYAQLRSEPVLAVAEIEALGWFASLRARSTGYVFYPVEEEAHAS